MKNITEVVFGDSLCHEIKKSKFANNNFIIKFDMLFSICDLSNINKNIINLNDEYCNLINSELIYDVSNIYSLKNIIIDLKAAINNKNKIRIWTSYNQIDAYLMFLYICNFFSNIDYDLYVLYSDEFDKECYSPACMNENELEKLLKFEHKLTKQEIKEYSNEWKQIVIDNSDMRVIKNGKAISVSFNYYDDIILNKLKELGEVKTVSLVSNLMKDIHLYDTVFTYLIDKLIKDKKIIITNKAERLWKSTIKINNN